MRITASNAAAAGHLVSSSTMAALLRCLLHKRVLTPADIREIYETALLLLEQQQAGTPEHAAAFIAARAAIEDGLAR
jgi:hypothetical protein